MDQKLREEGFNVYRRKKVLTDTILDYDSVDLCPAPTDTVLHVYFSAAQEVRFDS